MFGDNSRIFFLISPYKHVLLVLIRRASNEYQQHMFLWRTGENYPIIITKYSSLTIKCCLSFIQQFLKTSTGSKMDLLMFWENYGKELWFPNIQGKYGLTTVIGLLCVHETHMINVYETHMIEKSSVIERGIETL